VFAAASLTVPFTELEQRFETGNPGIDVQCNFAGTPQLMLQIAEGAAVDVFAAADEASMQRVAQQGHAHSPPRLFARNRLAIVVPAGNPRRITSLADLAQNGLKVALCGPEVPAGRYARQALASAKVTVPSVSDEPSVKALVAKVQLGELDAGIVYATDCTANGVAGVAIADTFQVSATYPIAVCNTGANTAVATAFVDFVLSPVGREVLARHGFAPP
jgi:molybdate transport system substrate-binding protein